MENDANDTALTVPQLLEYLRRMPHNASWLATIADIEEIAPKALAARGVQPKEETAEELADRVIAEQAAREGITPAEFLERMVDRVRSRLPVAKAGDTITVAGDYSGPITSRTITTSAAKQESAPAAEQALHRACGSEEHDPANGKTHGYCVVCNLPWPCAYVATPSPAQAEDIKCPKCGNIITPMRECWACHAKIPAAEQAILGHGWQTFNTVEQRWYYGPIMQTSAKPENELTEGWEWREVVIIPAPSLAQEKPVAASVEEWGGSSRRRRLAIVSRL